MSDARDRLYPLVFDPHNMSADLNDYDADVCALIADYDLWRQHALASDHDLAALRDALTALCDSPDGEREWHNQGRSGVCDVVDVASILPLLSRPLKGGDDE